MSETPHQSESPYLEFIGTRVEEWRDGYVRITLEIQPHHLNRAGVVHGGILATLLDQGGGFCGVYCPVPGNRRYGMTLSLTSNFIAQMKEGVLTVIGQRTAAGRRIYYARSEVQNEDGAVVATGTSVHRYRSGSESLEGVPAKKKSD